MIIYTLILGAALNLNQCLILRNNSAVDPAADLTPQIESVINEILLNCKKESDEKLIISSKFEQLEKLLGRNNLTRQNTNSLLSVISNSTNKNKVICLKKIRRICLMADGGSKDLESALIKSKFFSDLPEVFSFKKILSRNLIAICQNYEPSKLSYSSLKITLDEINRNPDKLTRDFLFKAANEKVKNRDFSLEYYARFLIIKNFSNEDFHRKITRPEILLRVQSIGKLDANNFLKLKKIAAEKNIEDNDRILMFMILLNINPYEKDTYTEVIKISERKFAEYFFCDRLSELPDCENANVLLTELLELKLGKNVEGMIIHKLAISEKVSAKCFKRIYAALGDGGDLNLIPIIAFLSKDIIRDAECIEILNQLIDFKKLPQHGGDARYYLYAALSEAPEWSGNEKILIDEFYNATGALVIPALLKSKQIDAATLACLTDALIHEKYYSHKFWLSVGDERSMSGITDIFHMDFPLPILIINAAKINKEIKLSKKTLLTTKELLNKELVSITAQKERADQTPHFAQAIKIVDSLLLEAKP